MRRLHVVRLPVQERAEAGSGALLGGERGVIANQVLGGLSQRVAAIEHAVGRDCILRLSTFFKVTDF